MSICEDWGIDPNRRFTCEKCGHVWGPLGPSCPMCAFDDMRRAMAPKWIKCNDRNPEEPGWFLVWRPGCETGWQAEWDMGEWWDHREERIDGVTHWMPRPTGPVEP